jgi:hypothetical protein
MKYHFFRMMMMQHSGDRRFQGNDETETTLREGYKCKSSISTAMEILNVFQCGMTASVS